jgi:hypothetical protein
MSASTIQFVSTDLTNRFKRIGVGVHVFKRSDGSRHRCRCRILLHRNSTKSVDPLELRQLKMPLDGMNLGAKSSKPLRRRAAAP